MIDAEGPRDLPITRLGLQAAMAARKRALFKKFGAEINAESKVPFHLGWAMAYAGFGRFGAL